MTGVTALTTEGGGGGGEASLCCARGHTLSADSGQAKAHRQGWGWSGRASRIRLTNRQTEAGTASERLSRT